MHSRRDPGRRIRHGTRSYAASGSRSDRWRRPRPVDTREVGSIPGAHSEKPRKCAVLLLRNPGCGAVESEPCEVYGGLPLVASLSWTALPRATSLPATGDWLCTHKPVGGFGFA